MAKSSGSKTTLATYTVREVAEILGIGEDAAYEAARAGHIPALRIGRRIVVPRTALHRMLESGTQPVAA